METINVQKEQNAHQQRMNRDMHNMQQHQNQGGQRRINGEQHRGQTTNNNAYNTPTTYIQPTYYTQNPPIRNQPYIQAAGNDIVQAPDQRNGAEYLNGDANGHFNGYANGHPNGQIDPHPNGQAAPIYPDNGQMDGNYYNQVSHVPLNLVTQDHNHYQLNNNIPNTTHTMAPALPDTTSHSLAVEPNVQYQGPPQSIAQMNKQHLEEVMQNQSHMAAQNKQIPHHTPRPDMTQRPAAIRGEISTQSHVGPPNTPGPPVPTQHPVNRNSIHPVHMQSPQSQAAVQAYQAEARYVAQLQQTHRAEKDAINQRNSLLQQETTQLKAELARMKEIAKSKEWFDSHTTQSQAILTELAPTRAEPPKTKHYMEGFTTQFQGPVKNREIGVQSDQTGPHSRAVLISGVSGSQRVFGTNRD